MNKILKWLLIILLLIIISALVYFLGFRTGRAIFSSSLKCLYCGDFNQNGNIDSDDFSKISQNFNSCNKTINDGDLNSDGCVNNQDLAILSSNYKKKCGLISLGVVVASSSLPSSIFLDGIYKGSTLFNNTIIIRNIIPGNHTITFVKSGFRNIVKIMSVSGQCQVSIINVTLTK